MVDTAVEVVDVIGENGRAADDAIDERERERLYGDRSTGIGGIGIEVDGRRERAVP